jgi:hypothetical protein
MTYHCFFNNFQPKHRLKLLVFLGRIWDVSQTNAHRRFA